MPKLDPTIQSRLSPTIKTADRGLAGLQDYVLDAAIPLVNMLECKNRLPQLTPRMQEAAQQALKLIGSASAHISVERQRKASTCLNKEISTLVADEDTYLQRCGTLPLWKFIPTKDEGSYGSHEESQTDILDSICASVFSEGPPPTVLWKWQQQGQRTEKAERKKTVNLTTTLHLCSKDHKRDKEQVSRAHFQGSQGGRTHNIDPACASVHTKQKVSEYTPQSPVLDLPLNQQVSETTPPDSPLCIQQVSEIPIKVVCPIAEPSIMDQPIVHLCLVLEDPPWLQLTQRGIFSMAETICQSSQTFAGTISLFGSNWKAPTQDPWVIQTVLEATTFLSCFPSPTFTSLQLSSVHQESCSIGGRDTVPLAETDHFSNPNSKEGILLQHEKKPYWNALVLL